MAFGELKNMYRPLLDGQARTNRKLRWHGLVALAAAFLVMGVTVLYSTHHTRLHQQQQGTFAAETAADEHPQRRPSADARQPLLQQQLRAAQLEVVQLRQLAANVSGILSTVAHQDATTGAASSARAQQLQQTLLHPESLTAATAGSLTMEAEAAPEAGGVALGDAAGALESHIQAAQGAIHQAIGVLQSAGVQLDVLQQLQLDRLRMKWELYGRGRLQQRRQALAAQLAATRPAAATAAGKRSSAAVATAASASSKDAAAPLKPQEQGQAEQLSASKSASKSGTTSSRGTQQQQQQQQQEAQQPSRGILIVAGSRQQMANALVSIMVLRQSLNCSLAVEIVHYGAVEFDPLMARILATYNASQAGAGSISLVDGRRIAQQLDLAYHSSSWATASSDAGSGSSVMGFAAKAHALAYVTSFQQVLLLDADNLPLVNPDELFDSEPFATSGNLFWPDWWHRLWIHPELFRKLGQPVPWASEPLWKSAESGQVLLDRLRHVDVLEWLWWINAHSNITYAFMHGDKDSYRLAFSLADKLAEHRQVAMPPRGALSFHNASSKEPPFKHQGMVQHTPGRDQKPAFLHRTDHSKFFPNCAALSSTSACHVAFFTSPLTEGQAMMALEQGMAFPFDKVDLEAYQHECRDDLPINPDRPDDPARCKGLLEGQNIQPVPLMPIHAFSNVQPLLYSSYLAFKRVKALLDIGERQELEEKRAQQPARAERQQQLQQKWPSVAAGAAAGRAEPIQGRPVSRPKAAGQSQPPQQQLPNEAAAQDNDGQGVSESSSTSSSRWTKTDTDRPAAADSASAAVGAQLPAVVQSPDVAFQDSIDEHLSSSNSQPLPSAVAALMAASTEPPGDEASAPLLDEHEHDGEQGEYLLLSNKQLLQRRRAVATRRQQLLQQQRMRLLAPFP